MIVLAVWVQGGAGGDIEREDFDTVAVPAARSSGVFFFFSFFSSSTGTKAGQQMTAMRGGAIRGGCVGRLGC